MPKIIFAPTIAPAAWAIGEKLIPEGFEIEHLVPATEPERRAAQLESGDFLMGFWSGKRFQPSDYDHLGNIKLIQLMSAGYDGIDLERIRQIGVPLANNGGANSYAVSEHAIMLMLAASRNLPALDRMLRQGEWKGSALGEEEEHEIAGKTVGIVGAGQIGRIVARRLSGWEVELLYSDPVRLSPEQEQELKLTYSALDDLFRRSDIITLHAPANESTHHLINERTIGLMKREAIIVNCARGELIDEKALYQALRDKRIFSAGLDTFEQEPPDPANPLFTLPNVVLSPHSAGPTWESWPKRFGNSFANIERVARGEAPLWVVPELR